MGNFPSFIFLLLNTYLLGITNAHVSLTFPPARKLNLDFLDFFRTKPPCGMPKGKFRTTFMSGSEINVTWHLSYPHSGGFRLELLDKNEKFTTKLSDPTSASFYVSGDPTAQLHTVQLPDQPCEDCTLRLIREIKEYNGFALWSCADISIVKPNDYKEECLGRGKANSHSMCMCEKEYWGSHCQYKDECVQDGDCWTGKCIDIGGTTLPRKQCFCPAGFHGDRCQLQNKVMLLTPENLQFSRHIKTELSDRITLYHRVVSEGYASESEKEIEFVLVVNGTSFVAVGWRPASLNTSCLSMPIIDDDENIVSEQETVSKNSVLGDVSPYKLEYKNTLYTPKFMKFHGMDCSDIIIGTARGMSSRIRDFYTRDRSTPRLDTFYGGTEDITSATGWELNGITTIIFRRKVKTGDPTDHELSGSMHVIWARGQEHGEYVHVPKSGLETENPSIPNFYAQDELKYHGKTMQRGITYITFS